MIRFTLGMLMLLIGIATMESLPTILNYGLVLCLAGLGIMYWAVPTLQKKHGDK